MLLKIKRWIKSFFILKKSIHIQIKKTIRCGDRYGGFNVYADQFIKEKSQILVYSFGIGENLTFSDDILKEFSAQVFAFDPTPKAINYVENHVLFSNHKFHFFNWGVSSQDGLDVFFLPKDERHVSGSIIQHSSLKNEGIEVIVKKLGTIMRELGHNKIDLLKMDFVGLVFDVIDNILDENITFGQLCLEVHNRFFEDGNARLEKLFRKLNDEGFELVDMSKSLQEFTFVNEKYL